MATIFYALCYAASVKNVAIHDKIIYPFALARDVID